MMPKVPKNDAKSTQKIAQSLLNIARRYNVSHTAPLAAETLAYQPNSPTIRRNATVSAKRYHSQPKRYNISQTVPLSAAILQYPPNGTTVSRNAPISALRYHYQPKRYNISQTADPVSEGRCSKKKGGGGDPPWGSQSAAPGLPGQQACQIRRDTSPQVSCLFCVIVQDSNISKTS